MQDANTTHTYAVDTHLSKTEKGGVVIASISGCHYEADDTSQMLRAAVVGDTVEYPDGSRAEITSGAGYALMDGNHPLAIVGSHVSGDDKIIYSPVTYACLHVALSDDIPGFLMEGWLPAGEARK